MKNKFYLSADHAGWARKAMVKDWLQGLGHEVIDLGPEKFDKDDDYPDYAAALAKKVVADKNAAGVLLCGNAQGICIAANKVAGIRAALGYNVYAAQTSRTDDDSNVLCLPGRTLTDQEVQDILFAWVQADFSGEKRHVRRLKKIKKLEKI